MKGFFNYVLASMLGTFLIIVLLGLINFIVMLGIMSTLGSIASEEKEISDKAILHLDFQIPVADRSSAQPNFNTFQLDKTVSIRSFTETIKRAKDDERIQGIFLDLSMLNSGLATLEEVRNSLLDFKESGKFIIAHAEYYTHGSYYLASIADKIYLTPEGMVQHTGLSAQIMFFKSMLEKIGIEPEIIRHGKFKSAVEPFMQDNISEANKEQTMKYVGSIWNTMLKGIAKERSITEDQLNLYADSLFIASATSAKTFNFVDDLLYKDEILAELESLSKIDKEEEEELDLVSIMKYMNSDQDLKDILNDGESTIAIIYAEGSIVSGKGGDEQIGSESLSKAIRDAREDDNVKAIVLRINSPGGSALASEVIWRETLLAEKEKPFIVSMGDVAASGGYYIACMADTIVAQPNTITGSIGVFGMLFNAKELMNDIGVNIYSVNTNTYSDLGSPARKMTEFERAFIKKSIEEIYDTFIKHVAAGRDLSVSDVDSIGQGRVWSGEDAKEIGLVDVLGGLGTAVDIAADMAGLEDYSVKTFPEKDKFTLIIESMLGEAKKSLIEGELGDAYIYYKRMKEVGEIEGIQARLPYYIDIK